jgi:hypothetical protein
MGSGATKYSGVLDSASGGFCGPGSLPPTPGGPGDAPDGRFLQKIKVWGRFRPGSGGGPEALLERKDSVVAQVMLARATATACKGVPRASTGACT